VRRVAFVGMTAAAGDGTGEGGAAGAAWGLPRVWMGRWRAWSIRWVWEAGTRPFLRFSSSRFPVVVADFLQLRVTDPDERDRTRGYLAARRFLRTQGHMRIPLDRRDAHDPRPSGRAMGCRATRGVRRRTPPRPHPQTRHARDGVVTSRRRLPRRARHRPPLPRTRRTPRRPAERRPGRREDRAVARQTAARRGADNDPQRRAALNALDPWWRPDGWATARVEGRQQYDCTSDEAGRSTS
jgi:hypothetical protein